jgi:hypothetical protein
VFEQLGARNYAREERNVDDFYATPPSTINDLLRFIQFDKNIWECACGQGHLSKRLEDFGYIVTSTDLIDRGYGVGGVDFLKQTNKWRGDIVTNPPYRYALEFINHSLSIVDDGSKIAMFLKIQFLEGQKRKQFYDKHPPRYVLIFSERQTCAMDGNFEKYKASPMCFAWYVWEKGYTGDTVIKWI